MKKKHPQKKRRTSNTSAKTTDAEELPQGIMTSTYNQKENINKKERKIANKTRSHTTMIPTLTGA